jgi:DUF2891 family protein
MKFSCGHSGCFFCIFFCTFFLLVCCCSRNDSSQPAPKINSVSVAAPIIQTAEPDFSKLLESLPKPMDFDFDTRRAASLSELSLKCVSREYPNKPSNVVDGDNTVLPPRKLHPAFFGCFDWHSAVHGHWAMVRLLKQFPAIETADEIRASLNRNLTEENLQAELAYFQGEHHALFERPYGWGWFLRLKAELDAFDNPDAKKWSRVLEPLAIHLRDLTGKYLETLSVPVRAGTHHSTAFALTHIHDYATITNDQSLKAIIERRSRDFYIQDTDCPSEYEPSGEDFVSPCLVEADLMRRVMERDEFGKWLESFLPPLDSPKFESLRKPIEIKNKKDPKIGHLIGLFFQRAAAYKGIARALGKDDPRRNIFIRLSDIHRDAGLNQMDESGYGGAHWLASFAIYLLTDSQER